MSVNKGTYNQEKWDEFLKDAKKRRESNNKKNNIYEKYRDKFVETMRTYYSDKKDILGASLRYYKEAITIEYFNKNYITLNEKHIKYALSKCKIMVITANPIERAVLHHKIIDQGSTIMVRILCDTTAYYVFKWGKYWVAHIHQSQTGSYKDMGASTTIDDALKFFTPNVIISLGIAFGIDYETQNIGDVLVSRKLYPYSENKRDEDIIKPDRTQDKIISDWLHVRLEHAIGFLDRVTYGGLLSGGSVMSSFGEKDRICLAYSKEDYVIGGEMEGNAVFQYSKRTGIPGVVIKAICDWGVAKNNIFKNDPEKEDDFKNSLQAYAMGQAVDKCDFLFYDKELFSIPPTIKMNKLKTEYKICSCLLLASQLIMIISGLYGLILADEHNHGIYILEEIRPFMEHPLIWLIMPLFLFLCIAALFGVTLIHNIIIIFHIWRKKFWRKILDYLTL